MSNKTQLQTNNTTLTSLIETLRGKAAGGGNTADYTVYVGTTEPTTDIGNDGDIYIVRTVSA